MQKIITVKGRLRPKVVATSSGGYAFKEV